MKKWSRFGLATAAVAVTLPLTVLGATGGANAATKAHKSVTLTLMYGSSGPAETAAVNGAAAAWAKATGNHVTIKPTNGDVTITSAFSAGTPPDVFYMGPGLFSTLAAHGQVAAYANKVAPKSNFYSALVNEYSKGGKWYAVPKDFSNLALEINTTMWHAAHLGAFPKTWAQLATDAKKLTKGTAPADCGKNVKVTGLDMGNTIDRLGAFFKENGGSYVSSNGKSFVFNSPQNVQALNFVKGLAKQGVLKWPPQQSSGWAGQAFGQGCAAMATEGNWVIGAMTSTYPSIKWTAVPMPAGPHGQHGTLTFTNAWGIPAESAGEHNTAAAISFVKFLTSVNQQVKFAKGFGVLPSRISAAKQYVNRTPGIRAFVAGAAYALPQVSTIGFSGSNATPQGVFDNQVANLASLNAKTLLDQLQTNAQSLGKP